MLDRSYEIFAPLLSGAAFDVHRIKVGLEIAIGPGYITHINAEQDVQVVIRPEQVAFHRLIVGNAARDWLRVSSWNIDEVNFIIIEFFLALIYRGGHECELAAVGRSH